MLTPKVRETLAMFADAEALRLYVDGQLVHEGTPATVRAYLTLTPLRPGARLSFRDPDTDDGSP